MLGTEGGSGEWARLCTHRPHDCIDRSKVQARDEVNVEFRLLAHHAELAFPGAGQASHRAPGAAAWGGSGPWGHTVLVKLQETVKDRGAWWATVHGVTKSQA